jgi:hypothetical protein
LVGAFCVASGPTPLLVGGFGIFFSLSFWFGGEVGTDLASLPNGEDDKTSSLACLLMAITVTDLG